MACKKFYYNNNLLDTLQANNNNNATISYIKVCYKVLKCLKTLV